MTPVYQTRHGPPDGNCMAACVATILDMKLVEVDVDVASCGGAPEALLSKIEHKARCKVYGFPHEAIVERIVKANERYCIVEVCSCMFNNDPSDRRCTWHTVVCEIGNDGMLSMVFNPDQHGPAGSLPGAIRGVEKPFHGAERMTRCIGRPSWQIRASSGIGAESSSRIQALSQ
jgi:hypothetical protein